MFYYIYIIKKYIKNLFKKDHEIEMVTYNKKSSSERSSKRSSERSSEHYDNFTIYL